MHNDQKDFSIPEPAAIPPPGQDVPSAQDATRGAQGSTVPSRGLCGDGARGLNYRDYYWMMSLSDFLAWIQKFRIHPVSYGPDIPLTTVQSSVLNAELIFRRSQITESLALTLPSRTVTPEFTADVDTHLKAAAAQSYAQRTANARGIWSSLLDDGAEPTTAQLAEVLAHKQSPELRDRLIADTPALDLPMELLLFGESDTAPDWDRIDTAEGLL